MIISNKKTKRRKGHSKRSKRKKRKSKNSQVMINLQPTSATLVKKQTDPDAEVAVENDNVSPTNAECHPKPNPMSSLKLHLFLPIEKLSSENDFKTDVETNAQSPSIQSPYSSERLLKKLSEKKNHGKRKNNGRDNVKFVLKKVWGLGLVTYINQTLSFVIYPGFLLETDISFLSFTWYAVLLVTVFTIFDTIGRFISGKMGFINKNNIWIAIIIRVALFIGILFIPYYEDSSNAGGEMLHSDAYKIITFSVCIFLYGVCISLAIILSNKEVRDSDKDVACSAMIFSQALGVISGTIIATFGLGTE